MNQLIKITETNGKKAVSARELYERLGFAPQHWAMWFKKNITENPFAILGADFSELPLSGRTADFALSLDFAKKLSMLARTDAGEKVRNYFIEVEKVATGQLTSLEPEEILMQALQLQIEQKKRLTAVEQDVKELKAQSVTRPNWFTIVGYATLHNMNIGLSVAGSLGKKASKICKERGIAIDSIPDPRFGRVHLYPENILNEVFNQPIM